MQRKLVQVFRLLALVAFTAIPAAAFAGVANPFGGNSWPIYAFANGNVLYNLLYASKGLVASSGYWDLIMLTAMAALLPIGYAAAHNSKKAQQGLGLFIGLTVITSIGVRTTANAVIIDTVSGYTNAIKGAPALVVLPESIVSSLGHEASQLIEQFFSTPGSLQVAHGGGFDLANSLVQDSTTVQVSDPLARATLAAFTHNCIVPGIASGRLSSYTLVTSTQLWGTAGTLAGVPQSPLTQVYTAQDAYGAMLPCGPGGESATQSAYVIYAGTQYRNAYDYLSAYFKGEAPKWLAQSASTFSTTSTYSWLSSTLASAQTFLFGGALTQTTGESIEQAAAINSLRPAFNAAAVAAGQSQAITALAVSQGEKSQISSWATSAIIFRDLSGYLYSVLQAFVMALLPIIMVATFIPGAGHRIALTTMQVLFWLALWEPTLSIVDYIVDLYSQGTLGPVIGKTGGYSMMNLGVITTQTSHLMLAASFIASMVPLITWGLVKGGFAFTEFLTHGMGNALAAQAGAMAATGNVSLDQKSFHNTSIGQEMLMYKESVGTGEALASQSGVDATHQVNLGGTTATVAGQNVANAVSARVGRDVRHAETIAHSASQTASEDRSRSYSEATGAAIGVLSGLKQATSSGSRKSVAHAQDIKDSAERVLASSLLNEAGSSAKVGQTLQRAAKAGITPSEILGGFKQRAAEGDAQAAGIVQKVEAEVAGNKPMTTAQLNATLQGAIDSSSDAAHKMSGRQDDSLHGSAGYAAKADRARDFAHSLQQLADLTQGSNRNDTEALKSAAGLARAAATSYQTAESASQVAEKGRSLTANLGFTDTAEALTAVRTMEQQLGALPDPTAGSPSQPSGRVQVEQSARQGRTNLDGRALPKSESAVAAVRSRLLAMRAKTGQAKTAVGSVPTEMGTRTHTLKKEINADKRDIAKVRTRVGLRYNRTENHTQANFNQVAGLSQDRLNSAGHHLTHWLKTLGDMPSPVHGNSDLGTGQLELVAGAAAVGEVSKFIPRDVARIGVVVAAASVGVAKGIEAITPANPNAYSGHPGIDRQLPPSPGEAPTHPAEPATSSGQPGTPAAGQNPPSIAYPGDRPDTKQVLRNLARATDESQHPYATVPTWQGAPPEFYNNHFSNPPRNVSALYRSINAGAGVAATASADALYQGGSEDTPKASAEW